MINRQVSDDNLNDRIEHMPIRLQHRGSGFGLFWPPQMDKESNCYSSSIFLASTTISDRRGAPLGCATTVVKIPRISFPLSSK